MAFKIKDLMITLIPKGSQLTGAGMPPGACGDQGCTNSDCTAVTDSGAPGCDGGLRDRYRRVVNPADLARLKEQLTIALAEVEARERAVEEILGPKSLADIEFLEEKLRGALDELNTLRAHMGRQRSQDSPVRRDPSADQ